MLKTSEELQIIYFRSRCLSTDKPSPGEHEQELDVNGPHCAAPGLPHLCTTSAGYRPPADSKLTHTSTQKPHISTQKIYKKATNNEVILRPDCRETPVRNLI